MASVTAAELTLYDYVTLGQQLPVSPCRHFSSHVKRRRALRAILNVRDITLTNDAPSQRSCLHGILDGAYRLLRELSAMAPTNRVWLNAYILLALTSCQPCLGFLSTGSSNVAAPRAGMTHAPRFLSPVFKGRSSRLSGTDDAAATSPRRRSHASARMTMAAPGELWDLYLGTLESAPLLTKVVLQYMRQQLSFLRWVLVM